FYGESNGGDLSERIRVVNLSAVAETAEMAAWTGSSWIVLDSLTVPPDSDVDWDPPVDGGPGLTPGGAYRVTTSEDSFVIDGYAIDNATMPAADLATGLPVGTQLFGYGSAWHLRAVDAVGYTVERRAAGSSGWSILTSGSLPANGSAGAVLAAGVG